DKITLRFNPRQGDKLVKTQKNEMSIKAKVIAGAQEQEIEIDQRGSEQGTLEIVEVGDGKMTRCVLTCTEDIEEKKGPPTMQWEKKEKPLHGRKITLCMKDGALVREGVDGLEAKVLNKLVLEDRSSRLFPKGPVAAGDTWEVAEDEVRKFLAADEDMTSAKIKLKLTAVKDIDGRRCAIIDADLDLGGKAKGGVDLTMKINVEMIVWIERGYTLSVAGKGTLSMKGENDQFKMTG